MIDLRTVLPILVESGVEFVIVGGVAATIHGSSYVTDDLDICYGRSQTNLTRTAETLSRYKPRLRGAPEGLPFIWDAKTLQNGLNFTLRTELGDIDLLGEVAGVGKYEEARKNAVSVELFGVKCLVLSLDKLIDAKRAAGRPKDKLMLPELEALREAAQE